ncbi:MAG: cobalamin B12-binding domain-containing protein, partial [Synergistetes bacterium]|nr:cobalamin B12-binding domain-containing protein [Synergistota bacterium]
MAKVLLFPFDPVHDVALKIIKRLLSEKGHDVYLLPPDMPELEVIEEIKRRRPDFLLISRTISYDAAEKLARFIDLLDAQGLRENMKVVVGGKAITPELAAELGYDAGFGDGTRWEDIIAFVEEGKIEEGRADRIKCKVSLTDRYTYEFHDEAIGKLLGEIASEIVEWASSRSSPGVERAKLRERILGGENYLLDEYLSLCDDAVINYYRHGVVPPHVRKLSCEEKEELRALVDRLKEENDLEVICEDRRFLVFAQYGTGCPFMDIVHIKACEAWGADGVIHFDPSWGARTEGLLSGLLSHEHDGSIITYENLEAIKMSLYKSTMWNVRAHRGLNTPETALYAGYLGADLTKINIP